MSGDESLGSLHVLIGNGANDFRDSMRCDIDAHDGARFRDVDMWRGWSKV
jgi:hypothetical protein